MSVHLERTQSSELGDLGPCAITNGCTTTSEEASKGQRWSSGAKNDQNFAKSPWPTRKSPRRKMRKLGPALYCAKRRTSPDTNFAATCSLARVPQARQYSGINAAGQKGLFHNQQPPPSPLRSDQCTIY